MDLVRDGNRNKLTWTGPLVQGKQIPGGPHLHWMARAMDFSFPKHSRLYLGLRELDRDGVLVMGNGARGSLIGERIDSSHAHLSLPTYPPCSQMFCWKRATPRSRRRTPSRPRSKVSFSGRSRAWSTRHIESGHACGQRLLTQPARQASIRRRRRHGKRSRSSSTRLPTSGRSLASAHHALAMVGTTLIPSRSRTSGICAWGGASSQTQVSLASGAAARRVASWSQGA
jgi:hypothetical protein